MAVFGVNAEALAVHDTIAVLTYRSTAAAVSGDEAADSWFGSVAFIGSVVAIGVVAALAVWNARRNRRW